MESHDLRKAGLKVTHPRTRILELLEKAKPRHMTAEDIYRLLLDHGEDIGLATVYRVLTQFEAAGLVLKHNFESGQSVYELDRARLEQVALVDRLPVDDAAAGGGRGNGKGEQERTHRVLGHRFGRQAGSAR